MPDAWLTRPDAWELSACIEWLFAEDDRPFHERVSRAAAAGFRRVEFWGTSNKDLASLEAAIHATGVAVSAFLSEPAATQPGFLRGVETACELAGRLNAQNLIVLAGEEPGDLIDPLRCAAPIAAGHGVGLLLEPLNTVDHPGYVLSSTLEGLELVRAVDHPSVRLLYDLYHSVVMGEEPGEVLAGSGHLVGHVHIADAPGRHEPGTGAIDWRRQLAAIRNAGYRGALGLEFMPTRETVESLRYLTR